MYSIECNDLSVHDHNKAKASLAKPDDQKVVTMETHQQQQQRLALGVLTVPRELPADRVVANKVW